MLLAIGQFLEVNLLLCITLYVLRRWLLFEVYILESLSKGVIRTGHGHLFLAILEVQLSCEVEMLLHLVAEAIMDAQLVLRVNSVRIVRRKDLSVVWRDLETSMQDAVPHAMLSLWPTRPSSLASRRLCRVQLLGAVSVGSDIVLYHFELFVHVMLLLISHMPGHCSRKLLFQLPCSSVWRACNLILRDQIYILPTLRNITDL